MRTFWRWWNRKKFDEQVKHLLRSLSNTDPYSVIPLTPPKGYTLAEIVDEAMGKNNQ